MPKGYLLNPSTQKPKHCRCSNAWLDLNDGRCLRCGRQVKGHEVKAATIEETIFEMLNDG